MCIQEEQQRFTAWGSVWVCVGVCVRVCVRERERFIKSAILQVVSLSHWWKSLVLFVQLLHRFTQSSERFTHTVSIYDGTHAQVHVRMQVYTLLIDAERKKCTICKLYKNRTTILLMLFDIFSVHEPELLVCTQIYSVGACGNISVWWISTLNLDKL